jgi:hypothetical protein
MMRMILVAVVALLAMPSSTLFAADGALLVYRQQERDVEPYNTRILVTKDYMRMDDGVDEGDYLIFDRKQHLISSVTHTDGTVFEIPPRPITQQPPLKLHRRNNEVKLDNAPMVGKEKPHHRQLYVNDAICYNVVAVKGLLKDVQQALTEFRKTLAGEHAKLLPRLPADQQEPCDLALNIFYPAWQLEYGLPIQEWDEQGRGQTLIDYKEKVTLDDKLFTLPPGYRHYTTDSMQ